MKKIIADFIFDGKKIMKMKKTIVINNEKIIDFKHTYNDKNVEKKTGILLAGFINTHCHLELSYINKQNNNIYSLINFIKKINKEKKDMKNKEILEKIKIADEEMFRYGINAVGDIVNTDFTIITKKNSKIKYVNFLEQYGFTDCSYKQTKSKIIEKLFHSNKLNINNTIHSFYSLSDNYTEKILGQNQNILSIHNSESLQEKEFLNGKKNDLHRLLEKYGYNKTLKNKRKEFWLKKIKNKKSVLMVHNTFTDADELQVIINNIKRSSFVFCPKSNLIIERSLPDIDLFVKNNMNICIGTDSKASNDSLDILSELKILQENYPDISLSALLKWATINGAKALMIDDKYGSLAIGKQPGVLLLKNVDYKVMKLKKDSYIERIV